MAGIASSPKVLKGSLVFGLEEALHGHVFCGHPEQLLHLYQGKGLGFKVRGSLFRVCGLGVEVEEGKV